MEYPGISASCGRRGIGLFLAPLLKSDNYRRTKEARGFGIGGRQRQREYYDALRDLATPAMGRPPLIRIDAADRDPADAFLRHRERLRAALGV